MPLAGQMSRYLQTIFLSGCYCTRSILMMYKIQVIVLQEVNTFTYKQVYYVVHGQR